ncbi:MAG: YbjN domain-containing protein [Blastocatellia bacterium]|nr:YbjN domain-containing protein [Blastocatellia bacterium]
MRKYNPATLMLIFVLLTSTGNSFSQEQANKQQTGAKEVNLVALLEKSGYRYTKISEGVWEIPATGENVKEFGIRIVTAGELVLALVKLADRKSVTLKDALLVKLMELNHQFDSAKLALSEEMLYVRIDVRARLLDEQELKYLIEQTANVTDEAYPHIKPFVAGAK